MRKERIIIIALPGVGDALLATPMIELLRKAKPEAEIHALVMFSATREMFEADPYIDHVHFYDFVNGSKAGALKTVFDLRRIGFSISISIYPQNRREYNLIALLIQARTRLGVAYRRLGKKNLYWLNTDTIVEDDLLHCVEENVRLLSLIGINHDLNEKTLPKLRLNLLPAHDEFAENWMREHSLAKEKGRPIVGFHAGTALFKNHIKRRWSPEKFAELAIRLTKEQNVRVLLFGGPDDISANEIILKNAGDAIMFVKTQSLLDSVAVMKRLDQFISNDSALMHIAGALDIPTVAIFGPTNEVYVHPWKTRYEIVQTSIECRPCFVYSPKPLTCYRQDPDEHFMCIREISVESVNESARKLSASAKSL
jgi:ADP-heptose:LPS heptosyltransferase